MKIDNFADVMELVDMLDLESSVERRRGSTPPHLYWVAFLRLAPSFHGEWLRLEGGGVRFPTKVFGSSVSQIKTLA